MRLRFKPQTTPYTCKQATQAIALNTLSGTDYSDLDVVAASNRGYPLGVAILRMAQSLVRSRYPVQSLHDEALQQLTYAILQKLGKTKILPTLEDAAQTFAETSLSNQHAWEEAFRREPYVIDNSPEGKTRLTPEDAGRCIVNHVMNDEKERAAVQAAEKDPEVIRFYQAFARHVTQELLEPIKYRFYTVYAPTLREDDFSSVPVLSQGSLSVESADVQNLMSDDGIIIFGTSRKALNLPQYPGAAEHSWIIDHTEGDSVVLLDTNHHAYGHGPEVYVPSTALLTAELNKITRICRKH